MSDEETVTQRLKNLGFGENYIKRAIRIHEKNYGRSFDMNVLTEIIVRLECKDLQRPAKRARMSNDEKENMAGNSENDDQAFVSHMTLDQCSKLKIGDTIDHQDLVGRYSLAQVIGKHKNNLLIHYIGWSNNHDCLTNIECDFSLKRFVKPNAISRRPCHRFKNLKTNDFVDINVFGQWKIGEIRKLDVNSGQAQIAYNCPNASNDGNSCCVNQYLKWAHFDDTSIIAALGTKSSNANDENGNKSCVNQLLFSQKVTEMKKILNVIKTDANESQNMSEIYSLKRMFVPLPRALKSLFTSLREMSDNFEQNWNDYLQIKTTMQQLEHLFVEKQKLFEKNWKKWGSNDIATWMKWQHNNAVSDPAKPNSKFAIDWASIEKSLSNKGWDGKYLQICDDAELKKLGFDTPCDRRFFKMCIDVLLQQNDKQQENSQ